MLEISKEKVRFSRGDYVTIKLAAKINGEEYELRHGDKIEMAICKQEETVLRKEFTTNFIILTGEETKLLKAGKYRYDVKLLFKEGVRIALTYPNELEVVEVL